MQGKKLTKDELGAIQAHLGDYQYSMPVGMLGRGLVPTRPNKEWQWAFDDYGDSVKQVKSVLDPKICTLQCLFPFCVIQPK